MLELLIAQNAALKYKLAPLEDTKSSSTDISTTGPGAHSMDPVGQAAQLTAVSSQTPHARDSAVEMDSLEHGSPPRNAESRR